MMGPRSAPAAAARPPRPPVHHADEKQPSQQKLKVPVLEKHLVDQLSEEEQDSLNSKFQEASQADKKVLLNIFAHLICMSIILYHSFGNVFYIDFFKLRDFDF